MQYIAIKQENKNDKTVYVVNAIPLKNKNKSVVQKIPHPLGSDCLEYLTLDEAKDAVVRAGFSYILPDGKKEIPQRPVKPETFTKNSYEDLVFSTVLNKIKSTNTNVCAAAIIALAEFPREETFEILFEKAGEENDLIRKNAISGICRYGRILQDKIIEALNSTNWITRNSAINCIANLVTDKNIDVEKFIHPLVSACDDSNPVVQANAITTLALVYQNYAGLDNSTGQSGKNK